MEINKMFPLAGMNTVATDSALVARSDRSTKYFVRDAVNGFVTSNGKWQMREGMARVSSLAYKNLWVSPLQREGFATLDGVWVKFTPGDTPPEPLCDVGGELTGYLDLNGQVVAASLDGLYVYNGQRAQRLTIETPAPPLVTTDEGSLPAGDWAFALSYLRGHTESAVCPASFTRVTTGGVVLQFPQPFDTSITATRLYASTHQGGEFYAVGDYANASTVRLANQPVRGAAARFRFREPMPGGRYLSFWRGRLVVARGRTLHFSEPLSYHLHDPLHGFVSLPQRVTFIAPVDTGLWVGQRDGVVFLRGAALEELSVDFKNAQAPVPGSAIALPAELSGDYAKTGSCAVWLAENGHVIGTGAGALIEPQAGVMNGITARSGATFFINRRVITAILQE